MLLADIVAVLSISLCLIHSWSYIIWYFVCFYAFLHYMTVSLKELRFRGISPLHSSTLLHRSCYQSIMNGLSNLNETCAEYLVAP